jgi:enamine deaminase RidA (YjgF/YER057c/UK114 family)
VSSEAVNWQEVIGFVPVVRRGPLVLVAGTGPVDDDGHVVCPGDAGGQARRCLERIGERLASVGAGLSDVVQTRVMLSREADWEAAGRAHGAVLAGVLPVTTMVRVDLLDPGFLVEIEAVAWIGEDAA